MTMREVIMEKEEESNSNSNSTVKKIEKVCYEIVVDEYSSRLGKGMSSLIESNPFVIGGYSFTIEVYFHGADLDFHELEKMSLLIKNQSPKTAHLVVGLHIVHRSLEEYYGSIVQYGFSRFDEREIYHQAVIVKSGCVYGSKHIYAHWFLSYHFCKDDSIMFRATIGVVHDHDHHHPPPPPLPIAKRSSSSESCILFKVGKCLLYAQESIIATRCPALLSDYPHSSSNHVVAISDVEAHVFKAVLWFLHNNKLHKEDRKAIANKTDLFSLKMLAAADKFKLKDLRRQCESFVYYGDSEVLGCYYEIESNVKKLWGSVSAAWLPQKMKAA